MILAAARTVHELDAYWSAVVTTVPVLALAAVLEVRRTSTRWTARNRSRRLTDAILFAGYVLALCFSFSVGLSALAFGGFKSFVTVVNFAMLGSVGLVVLAPIMSIVVGGNADVGTILMRYLPLSKAARLRRKARRAEGLIRPVLLAALEQVDEAEALAEAVETTKRESRETLQEAQAGLSLLEKLPGRPDKAKLIVVGKKIVSVAEQHDSAVSKYEVEAKEALESAWGVFLSAEHNYTSILRVRRILAPWHITAKGLRRLDATIASLSKPTSDS